MKKQIANVGIHAEGDDASMKLFMNADTDEEMVLAAAGISRALPNVCEDMDQKESRTLAIRSLMFSSRFSFETAAFL